MNAPIDMDKSERLPWGNSTPEAMPKGRLIMLAMTEAAADAINALTQNSEPESEGGLRVAVSEMEQDGTTQLSLAVSNTPESGDQVVGTENGARVFMEEKAAEFLDDKVLDVRQDEAGQLSFAVFPQQQEQEQE